MRGLAIIAGIAAGATVGVASAVPPAVHCTTPKAWSTAPAQYHYVVATESGYLLQRVGEELPGEGRWIHMPDYLFALPEIARLLGMSAADSAIFVGEATASFAQTMVAAGAEEPPSCGFSPPPPPARRAAR